MRGAVTKKPGVVAPGFATGDGNRTRVSCLGSTRPTIERRPLYGGRGYRKEGYMSRENV